MTSELCRENAIRQWHASLKRKDLSDEDRVIGAIEAYERQRIALELRDVPDVPELVRYGLVSLFGDKKIAPLTMGEYVCHDQAAAVIADERAKNEQLLKRAQTSERRHKETTVAFERERKQSLQQQQKIKSLTSVIAAKDAEVTKISIFNDTYWKQLLECRERAEAAEAANAAKDKEIAGLRKTVGKADKALYRALKSLRNTRVGYNLLQDKFADLRVKNEDFRGYAERIIAAFDVDNDLDNPEKFNAYFDLKDAGIGQPATEPYVYKPLSEPKL